MSAVSMRIPAGAIATASRSSAVLNDPLRRLPEIPRTTTGSLTARSHALLPQELEVVARLDGQRARGVPVDDGLERLPRVAPLVHLEVRRAEQQQRLGAQAGVGALERARARLAVVAQRVLD